MAYGRKRSKTEKIIHIINIIATTSCHISYFPNSRPVPKDITRERERFNDLDIDHYPSRFSNLFLVTVKTIEHSTPPSEDIIFNGK